MLKLQTVDISAFIDDFIKYQSLKPVKWFMDKYGIDYDEYSYLSFCAVPATSYRTIAKTVDRRKREYDRRIETALNKLDEYRNEHDTPELHEISTMLSVALYLSRKKYSDSYINDVVGSFKDNEG